MAMKVAPKKRYFDKDELIVPKATAVLAGCGEFGASLANKARKPMIIIDWDEKAFDRLENPSKHTLVHKDIRDPEALAYMKNAGRVIIAISDRQTAVYAGIAARNTYEVPRVFVYSTTDSVSYKDLKLKTFDENSTGKL